MFFRQKDHPMKSLGILIWIVFTPGIYDFRVLAKRHTPKKRGVLYINALGNFGTSPVQGGGNPPFLQKKRKTEAHFGGHG